MLDIDFIQWSNKYLIGIKTIDDQHKTLLEMANVMYRAYLNNKHHEILESSLSKLTEYIKFHFKYEEDLFEKYQYPNKDKHILEHRFFENEISKFSEKYFAGEKEFPIIGENKRKDLPESMKNPEDALQSLATGKTGSFIYALLTFVRKWILNHIGKVDKNYVEFLLSNGIR